LIRTSQALREKHASPTLDFAIQKEANKQTLQYRVMSARDEGQAKAIDIDSQHSSDHIDNESVTLSKGVRGKAV